MVETKMALVDWLDDLCVRFIINMPQEELESVERICFQVEEAQWFYEDFIRPLDPSLPSMSLRSFCLRIFQHCPLLSQFSTYHHTTAFEEFLAYKTRVPVRGAIMLNDAMDQVVLVKGWKKSASWSFPRGKINKDENDLDCAIREVYEETGFDIRAAGLVTEEKVKYIEVTMREQHMRLYVFRGVPLDTHFEPRTRKEISKIQWYRLSELPAFKKNKQGHHSQNENPVEHANKFYMVAPFLVPLKKWIAQQINRDATKGGFTQPLAPSSGLDEPLTEDEPMTEKQPLPVNTDFDRLLANLRGSAPPRDTLPLRPPNPQLQSDASSQLKKILKIQESQEQDLNGSSSLGQDGPNPQAKAGVLLGLLRSGSIAPSGSVPQATSTPFTPLGQVLGPTSLPERPIHPHPHHPPLSEIGPPPPFQIGQHDPPTVQPHTYSSNTHQPYHQPTSPSFPLPSISGHGLIDRSANPPTSIVQSRQTETRIPHGVHGVASEARNFSTSIIGDQMSPEFPGLHAPLVPPASKLPMPKLSNHSLALLNVLKTGFAQGRQGSQTTDAPVNVHQKVIEQQAQAVSSKVSEVDETKISVSMDGTVRRHPVVRNQHQENLLDILRRPSVSTVLISEVPPDATHLEPVKAEPLAQSTAVDKVQKDLAQDPTLLGPQSLLSKGPITLLKRPKGNIDVNFGGRGEAAITSPETGTSDPTSEITARSGNISALEQVRSLAISNMHPEMQQRPDQPRDVSPSKQMEKAPASSIFDRRQSQSNEHKQTLLSLFGQPSSVGMDITNQVSHPTSPQVENERQCTPEGASTPSRLGSLSSTRSGQKSPVTAGNKQFLLGFLDRVAKSGGI